MWYNTISHYTDTEPKMIHIAIAEDEQEHADKLEEYVTRYADEVHTPVKITRFTNAVALIDGYTADYDLIFLDIRMPYMDGMNAAHKLREADGDVLIVFVTSMKQYAIEGYSVNAADYIVKPFAYPDFELKMHRIFKRLKMSENDKAELVLSTEKGMIKVKPADIRYVETDGHSVVYKLLNGEDIIQYGSLKAAEAKLSVYGFTKCNSCYLVNLKYVKNVKGFTVDMGNGIELQISQPKRKAFVDCLVKFASGKKQ